MQKRKESMDKKQAALCICMLMVALSASFCLIIVLGTGTKPSQVDERTTSGSHDIPDFQEDFPERDTVRHKKSSMATQDASQVDEVENELSCHPTPEPEEGHQLDAGVCYTWDQKIWELAAQVDLLRNALVSSDYDCSPVETFAGILFVLEMIKRCCWSCLVGLVESRTVGTIKAIVRN